jgi:hypothetical protein
VTTAVILLVTLVVAPALTHWLLAVLGGARRGSVAAVDCDPDDRLYAAVDLVRKGQSMKMIQRDGMSHSRSSMATFGCRGAKRQRSEL